MKRQPFAAITRDRFAAAWLCAALALGSSAAPRPVWAEQIAMGPYLQNTTREAVTIIWWTDFSTTGRVSRVEAGPKFTEMTSATETEEPSFASHPYRFKQQARVTGLQEDQTYTYRVRSDGADGAHTSEAATFRAAPGPEGNVHFAFMGDGRTETQAIIARHKSVFTQAQNHGAQFVVYGGDMVHYGSSTRPADDQDWNLYLTKILCVGGTQTGSGVGNRLPVFMTVGNHEIYRRGAGYDGALDTSMARFKAVCDNPQNGSQNAHWQERYYAFSYGPCRFVVLDANNTSLDSLDNHRFLPDGSTPDWEPGSEQHAWMVHELEQAQRDAALSFVVFHPSPYCRGVHGSPKDPQRGYELRTLDPIFRQYGVDAVLVSHDHLVERSLTGPDGFHGQYPGGLADPAAWRDERNLNYLTQGNSGQASRRAHDEWRTWMDITNNDDAPFYSIYFYTWAGDNDVASFTDVDVAWRPTNQTWRATFSTIQIDATGNTSPHDTFWLERSPPAGSTPGR